MIQDNESDIGSAVFAVLNEELDNQFPDAPFTISCINEISELDAKFTDKLIIFIYDDRADRSNYCYDDIPDEQLSGYRAYTKVCSSNGIFITLRDVLNAMVADPHYHKEVVKNDNHRFLESFHKSKHSDIQYTLFFGS